MELGLFYTKSLFFVNFIENDVSESESWHLLSSSSRGGSLPPGRHKHSAVLHDESMWIYGGMQDLNEKSDCWKWDIGMGLNFI